MKEVKVNLLLAIGSLLGIAVLLFPLLYVIGDGDLKMAILLMLAQSATTLEVMIGLIGVTLMIMAMLFYNPYQDRIRAKLDNIETRIIQWTEQYGWFHYYLESSKLYQDQSSTLIFHASQEEMKKYWAELKSKTEEYNLMLKETYDRIDPLNTTLQQVQSSLRSSMEIDYEKNLTISLILAAVGLGMLLLAIALPGTDSMLGLVAGQMVDPSLIGEERLNEILRIKDMLKSL